MAQFYVISGKKQSGKTTAANYIEGRTDIAKVVSFADPIKEFCQDVLGFTEGQITGTDKEKNSLTEIFWHNLPDEIRWRYAIRPDVDESYDNIQTKDLDMSVRRSGPMTAREVMQIFGTDIVRTYFGYDTWAKLPFEKWSQTLYRCIVIDDCRFPNEVEQALKWKATLIRLTRDVLGDDQHVSETALDNYPMDKYTHVIDNQDMTIEETQAILKDILDETS